MHIKAERNHCSYIFVNMDSHTFLADLSLFKPLLPVRVKVIYKGRTEFGSRFQKSQFILGDAKVSIFSIDIFQYYYINYISV